MQRQDAPIPGRAAKIHIGKYKTGTTSFQHFLARHRERLLDSGVLLVPREESLRISAALIRDGLPIPSVFHCRGKGMDFSREGVRERLRALLSGVPAFHSVLMSCEELSYFRSPREVADFKDLLVDVFDIAPERMEVAVVLRQPDDFLASYRAQISAMGFRPAKDRLSPFYCEPDSWLVDDEQLVRLWTQNSAGLRVLDYTPEGMIGPLVRALDLPLRDEGEETFLNTRRSRAAVLRRHVIPTALESDSSRRRHAAARVGANAPAWGRAGACRAASGPADRPTNGQYLGPLV